MTIAPVELVTFARDALRRETLRHDQCDSLGQLNAIRSATGTSALQCDRAGHLTGANTPQAKAESWRFNAAGNRLPQSRPVLRTDRRGFCKPSLGKTLITKSCHSSKNDIKISITLIFVKKIISILF